MLKQRQQLRLLQKISPQQIQFIKLLQIPTALLETRIKEELEQNPALNEGEDDFDSPGEYDRQDDYQDNETDPEDSRDDEFSIEDFVASDDSFSYKTKLPTSPDEEEYEAPIIALESFYDRIREQLGMLDLNEDEKLVAEHLIGSLDEDGYLRRPIPAVVNDLAFRSNIRMTPDQVEAILRKIQGFDPPGIGARDLQECLILQLERKQQTEETRIAIRLLREYFEEFSKKHFARMKSGLGVSEEKLKEIYEIIVKLNPKPGESSSSQRNEYIIPDFLLAVKDGAIDIKLNRQNAPDLRVNRSYINMYEEYKAEQKKKKTASNKETLDFVKNKIESAQWFIDAIRQRQFTLLNTMYAIAEKQEEFFLSGGDEKKLKPMILKDIAEEVGMDISTISRVANSKHVETEFGIFPLKYFFTEGIATEDGTEVSNREVKTILKEMIDGEEKRKPLSDDRLSELLNEKGYNIARRTVAKYREQLNIPVARLRKEM
ncbi:MAG: RNA polymerase factor sigma-54 [Bacteroidia bacterium]|nr:RNA polymerase factor sigma-54 [Bacteroidia bacterium]